MAEVVDGRKNLRLQGNNPIPDAFVIVNASKVPYLSVGIRYGGIKMWQTEFTYFHELDAFIAKMYVPIFKAHLKQGGSFERFLLFISSLGKDQKINEKLKKEFLCQPVHNRTTIPEQQSMFSQ